MNIEQLKEFAENVTKIKGFEETVFKRVLNHQLAVKNGNVVFVYQESLKRIYMYFVNDAQPLKVWLDVE